MAIDLRDYLEKLIPNPSILEDLEMLYYQNKLKNNNNIFVFENNANKKQALPFYRNMFFTNESININNYDNKNYIQHCEIKYKDRLLNIVVYDINSELYTLDSAAREVTFGATDTLVIGVVF